jgi:hypothetical protein
MDSTAEPGVAILYTALQVSRSSSEFRGVPQFEFAPTAAAQELADQRATVACVED